jgi:3-deoxy-alpha-D-manno-octulosonate 8-oxidase
LYDATIIHEKPLINALGPDFRDFLTRDRVTKLFSQM